MIRFLHRRLLSSKPKDEHHAVVSTFDLFSIGIGPSSSHTVGPMRAAKLFVTDLVHVGLLKETRKLRVDLYGSLALTGTGHGTPNAVLMGLEGESPEKVDTFTIQDRVDAIYRNKELSLAGHKIPFDPSKELVFHMHESLPGHPNGMRFCVFDKDGSLLATNRYYSVGGGFVIPEESQIQHENMFYRKGTEKKQEEAVEKKAHQELVEAALPFKNALDLLEICQTRNLSIAQVVFKNELQWKPSADAIRRGVLNLWSVMNASIMNGIQSNEEFLPGDLKVRRRAPALYRKLMSSLVSASGVADQTSNNLITVKTGEVVLPPEDVEQHLPNSTLRRFRRRLPALDWLSLYAIAVNEENAAGGRVVTAPTNGAAGVIPAVLKYYLEFISDSPPHAQAHEIVEFLLTSAAIGMLYKRGSSISAAEVGCQGEVGVACSMAAAALCAVMGGTPEQVENAAEIGMEHNLGLTCDPVGGLVQIPCIERNALGAVKAVTAAQLSLNGDGVHRVSLDQVIETMRQTGIDMQAKYKETSLGGLAVNVPLC